MHYSYRHTFEQTALCNSEDTMMFQNLHFPMWGTDLVFFYSVEVGFSPDIHRRILTAAQLPIPRTPSSSHSCIFQLHISVMFEEVVSQSGHHGAVAFEYSVSKVNIVARVASDRLASTVVNCWRAVMEVGDRDSIRPWHEDKDKMALVVVELVHLAVRFPS